MSVSMLKKIVLIAALGMFVGSIASLASILFVWLIELANNYFWVDQASRERISDYAWFIPLVILVPTAGGLAVGVLSSLTKEKRPLSLVDTIRDAQSLKFDKPLKSGLISAISAIISMGSGAPLGQYGPLAHLGATLGTFISSLTRATGFTVTMGLGCGAAAAIATAFNAPIAGLIFAHEVILRHYSLRSFAPVTVASVTGYIFANYVFDLPALFQVDIGLDIHASEFLVFILIGVIGAYIAIALMRMTLMMGRVSKQSNIPEALKPGIAGMVVGIVAIWVPDVLGIGDFIIRDSIHGNQFDSLDMLIILVAKMVLTALCLGFGMAGGIFSPALVIGFLLGAVIGETLPNLLFEDFSGPVSYAICGMVAVASPVIGAPLTAILIVFELTRSYDLAIAAMISVVFSNLIGYQLFGRSIFDIQLRDLGFDLRLGREKVVLQDASIENYISQDFVSVSTECSVGELQARLVESSQTEGYVVDGEANYVGTVTLLKILSLQRSNEESGEESGQESAIHAEVYCSKVADKERLTLVKDVSVWTAMEKVQGFVGESIPVVEGTDSSVLVGIIHESAIVQAYMEKLDEVKREEYGETI